MHMDPNIWGDPHQFRPERFLNADGSVKKDNGVFAFGGGIRILNYFYYLCILILV